MSPAREQSPPAIFGGLLRPPGDRRRVALHCISPDLCALSRQVQPQGVCRAAVADRGRCSNRSSPELHARLARTATLVARNIRVGREPIDNGRIDRNPPRRQQIAKKYHPIVRLQDALWGVSMAGSSPTRAAPLTASRKRCRGLVTGQGRCAARPTRSARLPRDGCAKAECLRGR